MVPEIQMDKHQVIINPLDHAEDIAKLSISEEEDTFEGLNLTMKDHTDPKLTDS